MEGKTVGIKGRAWKKRIGKMGLEESKEVRQDGKNGMEWKEGKKRTGKKGLIGSKQE